MPRRWCGSGGLTASLTLQTQLTRSPETAAAIIRRGGIVAFPTETVYGLGADIFNEDAIRKIFKAKGRPSDNPLIAHVRTIEQIRKLAPEITPLAQKLIDTFFPGPLTIVLRKLETVPHAATAGLETIGIRMPRLKLAQEFLSGCGSPVVAPSANLSGRPSPTTWKAVLEDLGGRIECILQAEATEIGLESTVVDCTSEVPLLLRTGAVSLETLREIVPAIGVYEPAEIDAPRSPGLKHKHYSPEARVVLIHNASHFEAKRDVAFIGLSEPVASVGISKMCDSVEEYASSLFEFFRECDRLKIRTIYCEEVKEQGIGAALMDRIRRAAANN